MFASGFGSTGAFIFDIEHKSKLDSNMQPKVSWLTCFSGLGVHARVPNHVKYKLEAEVLL